MIPWRTVERVETPEGRLELRQRDERDFLITVGRTADYEAVRGAD